MRKIVLFLAALQTLLANSSPILHSVIFVSVNTPDNLSGLIRIAEQIATDATASLSSQLTISIQPVFVNGESDIDNALVLKPTYFVFNAGLSVQYSLLLSEKAEEQEFIVFHLARTLSFDSLKWEYVIHPQFENEAAGIWALIEHYDWTQNILIKSIEDSSQSITDYLSTKYTPKDILNTPDENPYDTVLSQVARSIKPSGGRITVILTQGNAGKNLLKAAETKHIAGKDFGFLMSGRSLLFLRTAEDTQEIFKTGTIGIFEEGMAEAYSELEHERLSITKTITDVGQLIIDNGIALDGGTSLSVNLILNNIGNIFDEDHFRKPEYEIINRQNGANVKIGTFNNGTLSMTGTAIFPGDTTEVPFNKQTSIEISMNRSQYNHNAPDALTEMELIASDLCVQHVNERRYPDVLPNHTLVKYDYSFGSTSFNYDYAHEQIVSVREALGYATLSSFSSGATMGFMGVFEDLGIVQPVVGSSNTSISLSNRDDWPLYQRTCLSDLFLATLYAEMANTFGWKKVAILYQDEPWGQGVNAQFEIETYRRGIQIANDPSLRAIDMQFGRENRSDFKAIFDHLIASGARIVLLALFTPYHLHVTEYLYDLGVRRNEMIFFAIEWMTLGNLNPEEDELRSKIHELYAGAIQYFPATFIGEFGEDMAVTFENQYGEPPGGFAGFFYDSTLAVAHLFDYMLVQGKEYEDPYEFRREWFDIKLTGTTGILSFEDDSNDRSPMDYAITNAQYNSDSDMYEVVTVGWYSPRAQVLYSFRSPIIWPDGTDTIPSDAYSEDYDCPFPDSEIEHFAKGVIILYIACFCILLITFSITLFIWKRFWREQVSNIQDKAELAVNDLLLMLIIFVDAFQYGAMGPDFRSLNSFIANIGDSVNVDLSKLISMDEGVFWLSLNIVLIIVGVWVFLGIIIIKRLDLKYKNWLFCAKLGYYAENGLGIIGNACFIPINSLLLDVFICTESIGDDYTDSFLDRDCHEFCWKDEHMIYVPFVLSCMAIYTPLAVYSRPLWQEYQSMLHIKTLPTFLMIKSAFQMTLIVLAKTIAKSDRTIHGILFVILMVGYFTMNQKIRAFNYPRVWMWHVLSLFAVIWVSLLALLDLLTQEHTIYVYLLFVGLGVTIALGLILQYKFFPSFLFTKKHADLPGLLTFAFSKGKPGDARRITDLKRLDLVADHSSFDCDSNIRMVHPMGDDESSATNILSSQVREMTAMRTMKKEPDDESMIDYQIGDVTSSLKTNKKNGKKFQQVKVKNHSLFMKQ